MWLSFWVSVGFGVVFVTVATFVERPVHPALGYVPTVVLSVLTNGWEKFWEPTYGTQEVCLFEERTVCFETTDYGAPPIEPAGVMQVLWPWAGDQTFLGWLTTSVPLDLAASAAAAGLVWCLLRPFGHHERVEPHLNPFDAE